MKINKYTLAGLLVVVIVSLWLLISFQFNIIEKNIRNNERMMEFALPVILGDLHDNLRYNTSWQYIVNRMTGTHDFHFSHDAVPSDSMQRILKRELDQVLALNYPKLDYEVEGFFSDAYGCAIHQNHRPDWPKAQKMLDGENNLCICRILETTLDISLGYTNKEEIFIGKSARILQTSLLLIFIILGAFGYTIYTIRKQKKLSDLKRDFINNLTHEFKTPIFSISLAAKSLKANEPVSSSEKMNAYVDLIGSESKRLQTQVDKILQMALLDSGNLTLEKQPLDLHESIKHVAEGFDIIIAQQAGKIQMDLRATNPVIQADKTHLDNLLYNLIDNAQKYAKDSPRIDISTSNKDDGILLILKDRGIGMDTKTQKHIFDQFYRAQQGDLHNVKGFGLGLSYVKRILDLHQGTISLKSELGQGSEFTIFLPQGS